MEEYLGTISVQGKGSIHVVPDITRLEVLVESVFTDYDAAYKQAKENAQWMGKILEYNHLNKKLAKTIQFDISDHLVDNYDENDHYIGQIKDGFELHQRFKIDLGMDNVLVNKIVRGVGKFIKGAQINIGYTIQDPRPHQLKMIERADNPQAVLLFFMDGEAVLDNGDAVADVQTARFFLVGFVADGKADFVGDEFDIAVGVVMDGGVNRSAVVVPHHNDQLYAEVRRGIFHRAELVVVHDIARHADNKQIADPRAEHALGNDA